MDPALNLARITPQQLLAGARRYVGVFVNELPGSVWRHRFLLGIIALYWGCGVAVAKLAGMPAAATVSAYFPTYVVMTPLTAATLLIGRGLIIMVAERPRRPLTQLAREFSTSLATPERLAHAAPILIGMLLFGGTFTLMKTSIPFLAPFSWDVTFEQVDRWVHGGIAPWQLLHPLLGWPIITWLINWAYNFWFYFLCLTWVWQAFSQRDDKLRMQFFLSLTIGWVLIGNVAATLLSSAGPCYFAQITGLPDPFQPLMTYLHEADLKYPVWALQAQDMLWQKYTMREVVLAGGISAMPSMHVAMATLFALVCWRTRRWLGIVMTIYAVIIQIGSVHLAWHYAIDGYAGSLGMLLIWWAVGRALDLRKADRPAVAAPTPTQ
jgi:hypothetical protein